MAYSRSYFAEEKGCESGQEYPRESSVTSLGLPELCFLDFAFAYIVPCLLFRAVIPSPLQSGAHQVKFGVDYSHAKTLLPIPVWTTLRSAKHKGVPLTRFLLHF